MLIKCEYCSMRIIPRRMDYHLKYCKEYRKLFLQKKETTKEVMTSKKKQKK